MLLHPYEFIQALPAARATQGLHRIHAEPTAAKAHAKGASSDAKLREEIAALKQQLAEEQAKRKGGEIAFLWKVNAEQQFVAALPCPRCCWPQDIAGSSTMMARCSIS